MKVIKLNANLTVILSDGTILTDSNCTDKMYIEIMQNLDDEDKIISIMIPNYGKKVDEYNSATETLNDLANSKILTVEGDKIFIKEISSLILPEELVKAIVVAEKADDQETLTSYLNFWTLCCLNPNAEARKNLFWFLKKYGMNISSSGLFVAYRNVKTYKEGSKLNPTETKFISEEWTRVRFKNKKSPKNYFVGYDSGNLIRRKGTEHLEIILGNLDDLYSSLSKDEVSTVFTDGHSNTFRIQVGKIVSMPREMCDEDQDVTCSRGLHVAGRDWLARGYFGDTSLLCLVNPADVVAVP